MLLAKLTEHFSPDLLVLSGSGVASLLVFRSRTSSILRLVAKKEDDDDVEIELDKAAAHIVRESKKLARERNIYQRRVCTDEVLESYVTPFQDLGQAKPHNASSTHWQYYQLFVYY